MEIAEHHSDAKPGAIIQFGAYPQTAGVDAAPIKWRVLQNAGSALFVLSEYILDCKRYHRDFTDITWRDSDLRQWLNGHFYNSAFPDAEKKRIRITLCTGNGEGSPDTEDKVFLLSVAEVTELTGKGGEDPPRARRCALGTDFSKLKKDDGCHLYVYDKPVRENYLVENGTKSGCSWWWLRTQPPRAARAFFIGTHSSIRSYGRVNLPYYGVRPALKISLHP